ncbi:hypothetical protein SAMN05216584_1231, partial [Selenomonas sp. WCT3]
NDISAGEFQYEHEAVHIGLEKSSGDCCCSLFFRTKPFL